MPQYRLQNMGLPFLIMTVKNSPRNTKCYTKYNSEKLMSFLNKERERETVSNTWNKLTAYWLLSQDITLLSEDFIKMIFHWLCGAES